MGNILLLKYLNSFFAQIFSFLDSSNLSHQRCCLYDLPPSYEEAMCRRNQLPRPKNHVEISTISSMVSQPMVYSVPEVMTTNIRAQPAVNQLPIHCRNHQRIFEALHQPGIAQNLRNNRYQTQFNLHPQPRSNCVVQVDTQLPDNRETQHSYDRSGSGKSFQWKKILLIYVVCVFLAIIVFNTFRNSSK